MASLRAPFVYTESRLNLDQPFPGSTVQLTLPTSNPSAFLAGRPPQRTILHDISPSTDLSTFTQKHLASEASVFFRRSDRTPRSFLWRLLHDRFTLQIQAVDLTQETKEDAQITISLKFPAPIRPFGLGFADPDEKDALNVFAITEKGLYTITLSRDCFIHLKATETLPNDWYRVHTPQALIISTPFRLTVLDEHTLFIALTNDSLIKLRRGPGEDGTLNKIEDPDSLR